MWLSLVAAMALASSSPAPLQANASADSGDRQALAHFLSLGFGSASKHFAPLRSTKTIKKDVFVAAVWPDHVHFFNCRVFQMSNKNWAYSCEATWRTEHYVNVFNTAADAVGASLPAGYASDGSHDLGGGSGIIEQDWARAGSAEIYLRVDSRSPDNKTEESHYTIIMVARQQ